MPRRVLDSKPHSRLGSLGNGALGVKLGSEVGAADQGRWHAVGGQRLDQIAPWLAGRLTSLGTDGFGLSDTREALRRHFEVDAAAVVAAALWRLAD